MTAAKIPDFIKQRQADRSYWVSAAAPTVKHTDSECPRARNPREVTGGETVKEHGKKPVSVVSLPVCEQCKRGSVERVFFKIDTDTDAKAAFESVKQVIRERNDHEVTNDEVLSLLVDVWWYHERNGGEA